MPTCFSAQMRLARDGEEVVIYIVFPRGVSLSPFRQDLPERREAPSVVVSACHIGDSYGWTCIREARSRGSSPPVSRWASCAKAISIYRKPISIENSIDIELVYEIPCFTRTERIEIKAPVPLDQTCSMRRCMPTSLRAHRHS